MICVFSVFGLCSTPGKKHNATNNEIQVYFERQKMQRRIMQDLWCGRSFFRIFIVTCCLAWKWKITQLVCCVNNISQFVRKQFFTAKKWPDKSMSWMISRKMNIAAIDTTHSHAHDASAVQNVFFRLFSGIECFVIWIECTSPINQWL